MPLYSVFQLLISFSWPQQPLSGAACLCTCTVLLSCEDVSLIEGRDGVPGLLLPLNGLQGWETFVCPAGSDPKRTAAQSLNPDSGVSLAAS